MPLAKDSAEQALYSSESGVKLPRVTSGMNKTAPLNLVTQKNDLRGQAEKEDKDDADHAKILDTAKKRFSAARSVESTNRKEGLEDLKFIDNKQWDQADWINALVFVGVGLAVLGNVATFVAEVRRASSIPA